MKYWFRAHPIILGLLFVAVWGSLGYLVMLAMPFSGILAIPVSLPVAVVILAVLEIGATWLMVKAFEPK